jgi:Zn-dependent protease
MSDLTPRATRCASCGTELSWALLACPSCHALVHRDELQWLASQADALLAAGDTKGAAARWREALALLPPHSAQYDAVAKRVEELTLRLQSDQQSSSRWKAGGVTALLVGALTKGKLLLAGLLKLPTLLSMLAFAGVYWSIWGWKFAVAIVIGIYIHEMGHVAALRARGLPASAPMFLPGFGAYVRLQSKPATPREDSYIGLAGPVWGLGAAVVAAAIFALTRNTFWAAIAHTTAVLNLFNLTPVWSLDGSRGFASQSTRQRWFILVILAAAFVVTREGMLVVVALVALWRAFQKNAPRLDDWAGFTRYAVLVIALAALTKIPISVR